MPALKQLLGGNLRQLAMVIVLILEILLFQFLTGGTVLSAQNLQNVLSGNTYVLILAMGMVLVIIAGHIDLSVGSVAAVIGIVLAKVTSEQSGAGLPWWLGIGVALIVGVIIGSWHGFWVAIVGVPAFVVTLGGMLLFRGMNQFIGKSLSIPVPDQVKFIGAGYMNWLPPIAIGNWIINSETIILAMIAALLMVFMRTRKRVRLAKAGAELPASWIFVVQVVFTCIIILLFGWIFATGRPGTSLPISGIIVILLFLFYNFLSRNTPLGRGIYAVGGNRVAAALTGISVRKVNFFVMFNSSVLAAIAAVCFVGRSGASTPFDGNLWELDAIASVFIGGASVWGGIGTLGGTMVGALVMAFLNNGLQLLGVGTDWTQMIKGLVLLLAVAFDVLSKKQGKPSIIGLFSATRKRNQASSDTVLVPENDSKKESPEQEAKA
ncbi:ABC transporter permease subunit [Mobiluncus sp.]|uniref:sugar ABC transporter permease n=1 Tax=Mobiluncus sp. TaxID=47293 RepID=UPI002A91FF42|nr:sugar ABC transporter permease [Mobiluncus sp.]MDY6076111.1 sugar ABC transporter permease [Mobiluncus sp.]